MTLFHKLQILQFIFLTDLATFLFSWHVVASKSFLKHSHTWSLSNWPAALPLLGALTKQKVALRLKSRGDFCWQGKQTTHGCQEMEEPQPLFSIGKILLYIKMFQNWSAFFNDNSHSIWITATYYATQSNSVQLAPFCTTYATHLLRCNYFHTALDRTHIPIL